jgi:hypothetical protein
MTRLTAAYRIGHRFLVQKTNRIIRNFALFLDKLYFPDDHDQVVEVLRRSGKSSDDLV